MIGGAAGRPNDGSKAVGTTRLPGLAYEAVLENATVTPRDFSAATPSSRTILDSADMQLDFMERRKQCCLQDGLWLHRIQRILTWNTS